MIFAAALGAIVGLLSAAAWYVVNAVASIQSPAGTPESGIVALFVVIAVLYACFAGVLVGVAAAAVLPPRGHASQKRRSGFIIISGIIIIISLIGIKLILETEVLLLLIPGLLACLGVAYYMHQDRK